MAMVSCLPEETARYTRGTRVAFAECFPMFSLRFSDKTYKLIQETCSKEDMQGKDAIISVEELKQVE